MKLKKLILLLFIFLAVIPLVFLGTTNMLYYNEKLKKVVENDLKIAASTQIRAIENFLEERRTDVRIITQYTIVNQLLESAQRDNNVEEELSYRTSVDDLLFSRIVKNKYIESVTILDKNFVIIACSDKTTTDGQVSELKNIDPSYLQSEIRFTNVTHKQVNEQTKKVIAGVQAIYQGDHLMGYIVLEINLSFFEDIRNSASLYNNGTIYLIDGKKQLIAAGDTISSRETYQLTKEERADYNRAFEMRDPNSKDSILEYKARGDTYLSYYSSFDSVNWVIISTINIDEVLQTKQSLVFLCVIIVGTLLILLVISNYVISRSFVQPIENMIDKFNQIHKTQNYSIRMKDSNKNEIGMISDEINTLLSSIESYLNTEKQEKEALKAKAERDPLTGLFNKETIQHILQLELEHSWSEDKSISCLFLDIDDFKNFNTVYGHRGGDEVLKFIAKSLKQYIPCVASRQGGDEFIAFVYGEENIAGLESNIQAFLEHLNHGIVLDENLTDRIPIHCSIGVIVLKDSNVNYNQLIALADKAMYQIKHERKNGYKIITYLPDETITNEEVSKG